jgi:hypothetical protein
VKAKTPNEAPKMLTEFEPVLTDCCPSIFSGVILGLSYSKLEFKSCENLPFRETTHIKFICGNKMNDFEITELSEFHEFAEAEVCPNLVFKEFSLTSPNCNPVTVNTWDPELGNKD